MTDSLPDKKLDLSRLRIAPSDTASESLRFPTLSSRTLAGCGLAVAVIFFVFWLWPNSRPPAEELKPNSPTSLARNITAASSGRLTATGYVVAQRRAAVASKGTGRLKELRVGEGDEVKENEIIAVLEHEDMAALVRQLEAQVAVLQSRVDSAQAEADDSQLQQARAVKLHNQSLSSQAELEQAQARYRKAIAEVASAKANVALATAQLDKGRVELEYTYIRAPFDGTVLTKNADIGEVVAPFGSSQSARAAVVTIADMSSLQIEADVSEANISRIHVGQECEITLDSFPDKKYRGEVTKIVPTVDRAKATVLTKIKFLEIDKSVLPEMSAKVIFADAG